MSAPAIDPSVGMARCENCGTELLGEFCHRCGQSARSPLASVGAFLRHTLAGVVDLDSKAVRSARYLLARPGYLTAEFLRGRRASYTAPLQIYLVAVALFFLANAYRPFVTFDPETGAIVSSLSASGMTGSLPQSRAADLARGGVPPEAFRERFEGAIAGYMPTFLIGSVLLFALALALFYRRQRRPYVAHTVFALHWTASFLLLMILDRLLPERRAGTSPLAVAVFLATLVYLTLALRRVYGQPWATTIAKGIALFLVFQVGLALWMLSAVAIASVLV
ncbi:MAG TPA: DUF3667 domain-containing protein [Longimicrobiaceae bacterium]|nr:DUF3667 domain-containing protein [Longimicrobiaceae bacterium]